MIASAPHEPWLVLLGGNSTYMGDHAHAEGKSWERGDAAERPAGTQTEVKYGEEEPALSSLLSLL